MSTQTSAARPCSLRSEKLGGAPSLNESVTPEAAPAAALWNVLFDIEVDRQRFAGVGVGVGNRLLAEASTASARSAVPMKPYP
jgi:hypothetical protein